MQKRLEIGSHVFIIESMIIMVRRVLPQLSVFTFLYYWKYSIINISKDMRRQSDVRFTQYIMYK